MEEKFICQHCDNPFKTKANLNTHQQRAKYCLKIQGIISEDKYKCQGCDKAFNQTFHYKRHINKCQKLNHKNKIIILNNTIQNLEEKLKEEREDHKDQVIELKETIRYLQDKLGNIAEKAVLRPTTKNIQINNIMQNLDPLDYDDFKDCAEHLTLDHHKLGAEGYAKFALEIPLHNKIHCADKCRKIFKYMNNKGELITDEGLVICFEALCDAIKMKSYELAQEHYQQLALKFTEREMDECNTLKWAIGLARYRFDKDNKFCKEVIDYIKKYCNKPEYRKTKVELLE